MPERPILLFPTPEKSSKSNLGGGGGGFRRPAHSVQVQRVAPRLRQLQTALNNKDISVQDVPSGIEPEMVLVIETIGSVDGFLAAVKRIEGLEWLTEYEQNDIIPDEDFYNSKNPDKPLSGRLFFLFTNQAAMQQLLNLWNTFQNNPDRKFSEIFDYGLASVGRLFQQIKTIRHWDVQDRLQETGILDIWQEDLEHDENQSIRFEVELWYRNSKETRQVAQNQVAQLIKELDGEVLLECCLDEISYHALLGEIPASSAQEIIDYPSVDLVLCDSVMFLRPVGQVATEKETLEEEFSEYDMSDVATPTGDPVIALLDGLPLANHVLLADRLTIDDPEDYGSEYTVIDRRHGTEMASLIVHGDLGDSIDPLTRPVYVRPIMKPDSNDWRDTRHEFVPEDVLLVDHVHRAVRRLFEGDGNNRPIAPSVRIINFSIGDPTRQFVHVISPLARLLDWLSTKYGVVFVISAGNHHQRSIDTGISKEEFNQLADEAKESTIVKALYNDARHRRLLSPGESINGITVGSLHLDSSSVSNLEYARDLFAKTLPSPISAFGGGYRRSIKPDLIFNGGRVLFVEPIGSHENQIYNARPLRNALGTQVAAPSPRFGEVNKTAFTCGTSNAAALISRMAGKCYDTLLEVFEEQAPDIAADLYITSLLKAMVVHGCSWGEIGSRLQSVFQSSGDSLQIKKWISQWLGYGVPDVERVLTCTEQRATLLGYGQLNDEEAHLYELPLPPSLGARVNRRRLTVTVAWMSPIVPNTQKYRAAHIWFEVNGGTLTPTRQNVDWQAARRGTVQHEIFEGDRAVAITDDANLSIKVNCRKDATKFNDPVTYGLAVSLEVAEGLDIAIYDEIRTRIASAVEIRAQEGR